MALPQNITKIESLTFYKCTSLTEIDIPDTVTYVGGSAFSYCSSLTSVSIGKSVETIGDYAFYYCSALTSIDIPGGVTSIGSYTFNYCSSLTSVTVHNSVASIGRYALYYCSALKSIYFKGTAVEWAKIEKGGNAIPSNVTVYYARDISALTFSAIPDAEYSGEEITPDITVTDGAKVLVKDTDYTVSYSNNINVGTATVIVEGKEDYVGTKVITFGITEKSITGLTVSEIADSVYTGSEIIPDFTVSDGVKVLVKDMDYTVSGSDNINVGTAAITVTGTGNYTGTKTITFGITEKSITALTVSEISDINFTGFEITPDISVTDGETVLVKDTDYTVSYSDNTNIGTASVTVTGKGNYSGTKTLSFRIIMPQKYDWPILAATAEGKSAELIWSAVEGAAKYGVYRYDDGEFTSIDLNVTGTSYTVTGLEENTEYIFFVQAFTDGLPTVGKESYAKIRTSSSNLSLEAKGGEKSVTLTWNKVSDATKYGVYFYDKNTDKYTKINSNVTATTYTVTGLADDTEYTFFVQVYAAKWLPASDESYATVKTSVMYPIVEATGGDKSVTLSWQKISDAEKYGIYIVANNKFTAVDMNVTDTSYTVTGLDDNTEYTFLVQVFTANGISFGDESYATVKTAEAKIEVTYPIVKAEGGDKQITLTWSAVDGATKYGVYSYNESTKKYTKINLNVTGTTYTVTGLADNTEYTFFVQAYTTKWFAGGDKSYAKAKTNGGLTYPVVTATPGNKQITLTWSEVSGATKYGVYRYANGKYTKININVTETTYTVTGLAANTEYSFFVQAYTTKWLAGGDGSTVTAETL